MSNDDRPNFSHTEEGMYSVHVSRKNSLMHFIIIQNKFYVSVVSNKLDGDICMLIHSYTTANGKVFVQMSVHTFCSHNRQRTRDELTDQ